MGVRIAVIMGMHMFNAKMPVNMDMYQIIILHKLVIS